MSKRRAYLTSIFGIIFFGILGPVAFIYDYGYALVARGFLIGLILGLVLFVFIAANWHRQISKKEKARSRLAYRHLGLWIPAIGSLGALMAFYVGNSSANYGAELYGATTVLLGIAALISLVLTIAGKNVLIDDK